MCPENRLPDHILIAGGTYWDLIWCLIALGLKVADLQRGKSAPLCQLLVNNLLVTCVRVCTGGGFVILD